MDQYNGSPEFSVTWLLGLPSSPVAASTHHSAEAADWRLRFHSADPDFSVSWLLALLKPYNLPGRCPEWASQFETTDYAFRVSYLLGLEASKASAQTEPAIDDDASDASSVFQVSQEEEDADEDGLCLKYLFGDEPYPEPIVIEECEDTEDEDAEDVEPPVLATPEFLELCNAWSELLDELETPPIDMDEDDDKESIDGLSPEDREDDDPSRKEWLRQKKIEHAENKYMDRVMSLPGLTEAKAFFLNAKAKVKAANLRDTDLKKVNLDVVITGNQGTGKSTIARLYAKFLVALGVVKQGESCVETFSCYRISKTTTLDKMRRTVSINGGCIAILEDAHLLNNDERNLWNFYVRSTELPGPVVIIAVGDMDLGLGEQLSYRARCEHHFPVLKLPSYTHNELRDILQGMMRVHSGGKLEVEGGFDGIHVKTLIRRTIRSGSEENFSNIWPLKKAFRDASKRQVDRFRLARAEGTYIGGWEMTKEDLLGKEPDLDLDNCQAWKDLQSLIGLDSVKMSIQAALNQVKQNHRREVRGDEPLEVSAHRVFLGSPGTGKTTVAKLYGKLMAHCGILSKGDVIVKNPTDLIDRYIGGSEANTKEALQAAKGSILIIDDAHMLDPGPPGSKSSGKDGGFRDAVLDTLVAEVSGAPGEDRCVILCGYRDRMEEMYQNANPGLARRFPLADAFTFDDFDAEALGKILELKLTKEKLIMTDKAREVAMDILSRASARPNFGNGGEVDNILSKAILARTQRIAKDGKAGDEDEDKIPIEPEDIDANWDRSTRAVANTRALFKDFVGYEEIISKLESYQYMAQGMRLRGVDPRPYIPFTYVFKGPPGTGKTTTARKMGQIFYDMGFLSAPEVVEVSATALVGEYCGQTGPKTQRLLESALGKVLFIDEAYRLAGHGVFTDEAVSELVDCVTKPKYARKLIIVLAGYDEDMERLMKTNQGLRSRFPTEFNFRPMRTAQCLEQLRRVVDKVGIDIESTRAMDGPTRNTLMGALEGMAREKGWASGRSVETLGEKIIAHIFKECAMNGYTGEKLTLSGKDLVTIMSGKGVGGVGSRRPGGLRPMGGGQVMTLRDLEGYDG